MRFYHLCKNCGHQWGIHREAAKKCMYGRTDRTKKRKVAACKCPGYKADKKTEGRVPPK